MNRRRRLYHSGETTDLEFAVEKIEKEFPNQPLLLAGVSLGGNVLLKYLGERGRTVSPGIRAAAAVSVPFDLSRSSRHMNRGFSRVYQMRFMRSLKRKALAKLDQFPDFGPRSRLARLRTMYEFDDSVTAPLHGYRDAADYYARSSSISWIDRIRIPTLLLNAMDDPFLPADVLEEVRAVAQQNAWLTLELTAKGGHAAFVGGRNPFRPVYYAEKRVCDFLADQVGVKIGLSD